MLHENIRNNYKLTLNLNRISFIHEIIEIYKCILNIIRYFSVELNFCILLSVTDFQCYLCNKDLWLCTFISNISANTLNYLLPDQTREQLCYIVHCWLIMECYLIINATGESRTDNAFQNSLFKKKYRVYIIYCFFCACGNILLYFNIYPSVKN